MTKNSSENSNVIIEEQLHSQIEEMGSLLSADVLTFKGPIIYGIDDLIRESIESRKKDGTTNRSKLIVILETNGGFIEVAERIANTFRHHYKKRIEFIVPSCAMSAGTVLVMSGDAIHMDYFSVLGPIDPQIESPSKKGLFPALGYLIQYERLIKKSQEGNLTTAEMAFLIEKFDPAVLYGYEQARELSITLLKEWLVKYKFRNWKKTKTRRLKVTKSMRENRAEKIAKELNETKKWCSHSRGIPMSVLRRNLKLEIEDFGENQKLNTIIRCYNKLLDDYMNRIGRAGVLRRKGNFEPFM